MNVSSPTAGAEFLRADLHVHTFADTAEPDSAELDEYVRVATERELRVLAITDHNTTRNVRSAIEAAAHTGLLVLPGIEVSTHEGHLLAIFAPDAIESLEAFANKENLQLVDVDGQAGELRSTRSMLDLVGQVHDRGGLAIPAHVDASDGIMERMAGTALTDLLKHAGLAGLEFRTNEALSTWFTDEDSDHARRTAWQARQAIEELRDRGLARIMSSDAHSVAQLGQDTSRRTLTRLRLDDANFDAVRNAVLLNPKARCKAEGVLPFTYPRITSAEFKGGFLDGVSMAFSPNLTCIIGGRGSGKSTALLAVRAALGASTTGDDDPDDPERMPQETIVRFVDATGTERIAHRKRGEQPIDADSGAPIALTLADLGQDESGRLTRAYSDDPAPLLAFLDSFVDLRAERHEESSLRTLLADNAAEVIRTNVSAEELTAAENEVARLEGSLRAAETGKVEQLVQWASILASQDPLLARLELDIAALAAMGSAPTPIDLDALAAEFGVDLTKKPVSDIIGGEDGLRARLAALHDEHRRLRGDAQTGLGAASARAAETLRAWKESHAELRQRRDAKQAELEAQGLRVQAGAISDLAEQLKKAKVKAADLRKKKTEQGAAVRARQTLLTRLYANRDALYERRRATIKKIVESANRSSELRIHVWFLKGGTQHEWIAWLTNRFGFRTPRVQRLAEAISPSKFADDLYQQPQTLVDLKDTDGAPFFAEDALTAARTWPTIFELQTMLLPDKPNIEVQEPGTSTRRPFDSLSAGQQRSVLLSLILCAERTEPLILDQPEDHLDALYIAKSVVRHLEAAKERRQVILATHSANLTVLGDAELVIPMYADGRRGAPRDPGAVDRPATREHVCSLLEGGEAAFVRRAERYGFQVRRI